MAVAVLSADHIDDVVTVLCDAFFDYPVMRYVIGPEPDYSSRIRSLVGLFVAARVSKDDLMLGIDDDTGRLTGAALVNLPVEREAAPWFEEFREEVWAELGAEARARYDAFGNASHAFDPEQPHHHLGMIGVRSSHHGTGLGRVLLGHLHAVADADARSCGVSLTTEVSRNVSLYEYFGYQVSGHSRVAPDLETWAMFRPC
jgi:GNAT superfamily N-acetyltransferase